MIHARFWSLIGIAACGVLLVAKAKGYQPSQAERGARLYQQHCASCHGRDLRGGPVPARDHEHAGMLAPALAGPERFPGLSWAIQVFDQSQSTMPQGSPGSLRAEDYLDITAYLVSVNRLAPPNGKPLTEAELSKIPIPRP